MRKRLYKYYVCEQLTVFDESTTDLRPVDYPSEASRSWICEWDEKLQRVWITTGPDLKDQKLKNGCFNCRDLRFAKLSCVLNYTKVNQVKVGLVTSNI